MVSDSIILAIAALTLNYLIVFRKNKFVGGFLFIIIGISMAFLTTEEGNLKLLTQSMGGITSLMGMIAIIYKAAGSK